MVMFLAIGLMCAAPALMDTPSAATPSTTDASPAASFSIEGVHIGMTPAEADAAGVDIREAKHMVQDEQRGLLYRIRTDDKTTAEATVDAEGRIRTITVSYVTSNLAGTMLLGPRAPLLRPILPFADLVGVLAERWGTPDANTSEEKALHDQFGLGTASGVTVASGLTQVATWTRGNQTAVVVSTQVAGPLGDVEPVLSLCIGRDSPAPDLVASILQRSMPPRTKAHEKVKF